MHVFRNDGCSEFRTSCKAPGAFPGHVIFFGLIIRERAAEKGRGALSARAAGREKDLAYLIYKGTGGSRCGRGAFPAGLFSLLRREKSPGAAFLGGKTPLLPFLRARLFSEVQKIFKPLTLCLPWKKGCSKKNTSFPAFLRGRKRAEIIIYCFSLQK